MASLQHCGAHDGRVGVWAPSAGAARLILDQPSGRRLDLARDSGGWFYLPNEAVQADCTPGRRYAFELAPAPEAGQPEWSAPLPDPRSRRQPDGVHGFSAFFPDDFSWTDAAWTGVQLAGQVLYELHVGTFSPAGTFAGVRERLGYLSELGVTAIELMPVQPFSGDRNWGYDPVSWFAVHEGYGGPEELKALIDAAHRAGIAVVLDVVFNHFGPDGNYTGFFGPYTTPGATGWGDVVNLMGLGSDEVRRYILDAVRQWLGEFHVDGLRLDAVHALDDRGAVSILEQIRHEADHVAATTGRQKFVIAESDLDDPRLITAPEAQGYGLDAQWLDDLHHALHTLVEGEQHSYYCDYGRLSDLARALTSAYRFQDDYSIFRGRRHGRGFDTADVPGSRFVVYTTTHDQTGNRAAGDRPTQRIDAAQHALKCAFVFLSPFTPMIFMGEEFGAQTPFPFFAAHEDEALLEATRVGRLREFASAGWDPDAVADPASRRTYESAKLDWDAAKDNARTRGLVADLLRLRRGLGCAGTKLSEVSVDYQVTDRPRGDDARSVALERGWLALHYPGFRLVGNFSPDPVAVPYAGRLLYSTDAVRVGATETRLGPWQFVVLARD